jgi:uncharacterized membrane protein
MNEERRGVITDRSANNRLETLIGGVLRSGTIASTALFTIGLVMALAGYRVGLAGLLLNAALIILLATPATRVVVSVIEYIRERDWTFVVLTLVVLAALGGSVVAAYYR